MNWIIPVPSETFGVALEDGARVDRHVAAQCDGDIDERLPWVEHGDAVEQPAPVGAAAQFPLGERELPAVVDASGLGGCRHSCFVAVNVAFSVAQIISLSV